MLHQVGARKRLSRFSGLSACGPAISVNRSIKGSARYAFCCTAQEWWDRVAQFARNALTKQRNFR
jgi:hypothetical protein